MTSFADLVRGYLDEAFRLNPLAATAAGIHDHDHRWPDLSEAGRSIALQAIERWEKVFRSIDPGGLTFDDAIDRDRLLAVLAAERYEKSEARDETWDPMTWIYLLGDGLFGLLAREFAAPAIRLRSIAGRLEGIPAIIDAARSALGSIAGRPVSKFHTERALLDLPGIPTLIEEALALAASLEPSDEVNVLRAGLGSAAATARDAVRAYEDHLRAVILLTAEGEGRLGLDRYAVKLAYTLGDPEMTVDRVLESAERQFVTVRAEMARCAAVMWAAVRPGITRPEDPELLTRTMLDHIGEDHSGPDELLQVARDALVRIEAFCREQGVIGLADEPFEIDWTPVFLRGWAQAMLTSPGPFDVGQKAYFHITPIPDSWSAAHRESYLREMNRHQLEVLTIHEAVPGHYLQGVYGNRTPSAVRAVFGDGAYAEGWAVYVTQVMIDSGYGADDPSLALAHWKYYLRAVTNALIDIRIHTAGMTEDEALDLMIRGGFQEEAEARSKYSRARLTATQLSTYFVGSLGLWELEHEVRRRAAAASDDPRGAGAVPTPSVVGAYPPTPGFDYRAHLEALISHGALPLPLLRRAIVHEGIPAN